jgi:hypothetical protein
MLPLLSLSSLPSSTSLLSSSSSSSSSLLLLSSSSLSRILGHDVNVSFGNEINFDDLLDEHEKIYGMFVIRCYHVIIYHENMYIVILKYLFEFINADVYIHVYSYKNLYIYNCKCIFREKTLRDKIAS